MFYSEHHISNCYSTIFTMEGMCICDSTDVVGNLLLVNPVPISCFFFFFVTWGLFEDQYLHKLAFLLCAAHFSKASSQTISVFFGAILQSACAHILSHLWQRNKSCPRKLLRYLIIHLHIKTEYACMK